MDTQKPTPVAPVEIARYDCETVANGGFMSVKPDGYYCAYTDVRAAIDAAVAAERIACKNAVLNLPTYGTKAMDDFKREAIKEINARGSV